jgi:hypothetical protein
MLHSVCIKFAATFTEVWIPDAMITGLLSSMVFLNRSSIANAWHSNIAAKSLVSAPTNWLKLLTWVVCRSCLLVFDALGMSLSYWLVVAGSLLVRVLSRGELKGESEPRMMLVWVWLSICEVVASCPENSPRSLKICPF